LYLLRQECRELLLLLLLWPLQRDDCWLLLLRLLLCAR
jgi:hypothetical protein